MAPKISHDLLTLSANTIRMLAADEVEKANSGHPGMPMGMADIAAVLWLKHLRFNPADPKWCGRDRFVLSNGHGCALQYALLHLSGFELSMQDLQSFRQWESRTPGHPEFGVTPGVEATTGPLGQGISNAVGMAIAQKALSARYAGESFNPVDNKIFVFAGDGCMMEGISSEASSLAGHLGLGNIVVVYDDNHISIAGSTNLAMSEDVVKRYKAYGWHVQQIDGHDYDQIDRALKKATQVTGQPSLIAARTIIGKGAPHKANEAEIHGSPLGKAEMEATKNALQWPLEPAFYVPDAVRDLFAARVKSLKSQYKKWQKQYTEWKTAQPEKAAQFESQMRLELPADLRQRLIAALPNPPAPAATRKLSSEVLQAAAAAVPALIGGSADLEPSTLTLIKKSTDISKDSFSGVNLRFGIREHVMGAVMNGMSYYGGFIPYGSTFLVFSDYMRAPIRIAALSHLPVFYVFTHDSIFVGEDGPTHQPIEHVNALRLIPNLHVFRPADGIETAVCYELVLKRRNGPSALCLTRQNLDPLPRPEGFDLEEITRGAYVVFESAPLPAEGGVVFVATGSEVSLALAAARQLASRVPVRVVSMPCCELFAQQPAALKEKLIPVQAKKIVIEAGTTAGWLERVNGSLANTALIGIDHFGASAPYKVLAQKYGLTPESVLERARAKIAIP